MEAGLGACRLAIPMECFESKSIKSREDTSQDQVLTCFSFLAPVFLYLEVWCMDPYQLRKQNVERHGCVFANVLLHGATWASLKLPAFTHVGLFGMIFAQFIKLNR